jgi:MYXO-CTERM domain-containing protein
MKAPRPAFRPLSLLFAMLALLAPLLFVAPALAGPGSVTPSKNELQEAAGGWKLLVTVKLPKKPANPHQTFRFLFRPTVIFETFLDDSSPGEKTRPLPQGKDIEPIVESLDVNFGDVKGDIWDTTKFDFQIRRDRGMYAGEYTVEVRDSDNRTVGQPFKLKLGGKNDVVDRRAIVMADSGAKKKKDPAKEEPKEAKEEPKTEPKADTSEKTEGTKKGDDEGAAPPPPVKGKSGGCGCHVPGGGSSPAGASLLAVIGLGALVSRRRRALPRTWPGGRAAWFSYAVSAGASFFERWLHRVAAAASALVPLGVALYLVGDGPQWRDDVGLIRAAGLYVVPGVGAPGAMLTAIAEALPLGPHPFRAAAMSALCLSWVGWGTYALARSALRRAGSGVVLPSLLALGASLAASLSPVLLREATVGGGACLAVALSLSALRTLLSTGPSSARWATAALYVGVLAAESPPLAAVVLVSAVIAVWMGEIPDRGGRLFPLGIAIPLLLSAVPLLLRSSFSSPAVHLAGATSARELAAIDVGHLRMRGLEAFFADIGAVAVALAVAGTIFGLSRVSTRGFSLVLLSVLAADLLAPSSAVLLSVDALASVRACAVVASLVLAALGVRGVGEALENSRLPFARPAAVLVSSFFLSLAALAAEEGIARADRRDAQAGAAWTRESLERLPPSSLLLARSDAVSLRTIAARLSAGVRPDVTIVPLPLLSHGHLASSLLREEPALAPLLRDLSTAGAPSEYALASIADVRPLYVELDPAWDRTLAAHAIPERLFLRFLPQPLGMSDRRQAQIDDAHGFSRVAAAAEIEPVCDATRRVLASHARDQLIVASLVADKDALHRALGQLVAVGQEPDRSDPLWAFVEPQKRPEIRPGARARAK